MYEFSPRSDILYILKNLGVRGFLTKIIPINRLATPNITADTFIGYTYVSAQLSCPYRLLRSYVLKLPAWTRSPLAPLPEYA